MARKTKPTSRKRKNQCPEEDEKKNELILEEVLSISGKNVESADGSSPPKAKRRSNKPDEMELDSTEPQKSNPKKRSLPSSSGAKKKKSSDKEEEINTSIHETKASNLIRGDPVSKLPDGWRRQAVRRKSGKSAGQIDIYFYSPDGIKLRSRPDVAAYLKKHKVDLKIEEFDFSRSAKTVKADNKRSTAENNLVPKRPVQDGKSKIRELKNSKRISTEVSSSLETTSAEVPLVCDTEEENDEEKIEKACPEEKNMKINHKQKEKKTPRNCNSATRIKETQLSEDEKQNEAKEVSNKKVFKENGSSSARSMRSATKFNDITSTWPKKLNSNQKSSDEDVEVNIVVNAARRATSERGQPVPNLPNGWRREVVERKSGAGKIDIYFYSPDGIKLRSRPDVLSYLKKHKIDLKIEEFDFSKTAQTAKADMKRKSAAERNLVPKKKI